MSATEALAAVDTICVDKTGTLTDGELELLDGRSRRSRAAAPTPSAALGPLRRQRRRAQPHPGDDRRALPGAGRSRSRAEVPFSSEWKWSGLTLDGGARRAATCSARPTSSPAPGALTLPPALRRQARGGDAQPGGGSSPSARPAARCPADPAAEPPPRLEPRALVVLEETLRPDAAETIEFMREQEVDLKLISGDARATVTAVAYAVGVPPTPASIEGPELPDDPERLAEVAAREHDLLPDQARAEEGAGRRAVGLRPLHGDDRRRRQRRAGAEAGADGGRDGLRAAR